MNTKPFHTSRIGHDEHHRCGRCRRDLPWDQFPPLRYARTFKGKSVHLLHAWCRQCMDQNQSKLVGHPLYSPNLHRFITRMVSAVRSGSRGRGASGIPFLLTKDDVLALYLRQEGRCALTGLQMLPEFGVGNKNHMRPSLDRIDNTQGYIAGNVHLVCWVVNLMKQDLPVNRFVDWCRSITEHHDRKQASEFKDLL